MLNIYSINAYMKNMKRTHGLTMIELMVTVAVISVVVAIGLPRLGGISQSNRVTTSINALSSDMSLARSEAVTRNTSVTISSNSAGTNWEAGWVIQTAAGVTIRNGPPLPPNILLTGTANTVTFLSDGTQTSGGQTFNACKSGDTTTHGRMIQINTAGRVRLEQAKQNCPTP
jgi:prepilin-type N-terminal cleavage/methylation domain-containing protein